MNKLNFDTTEEDLKNCLSEYLELYARDYAPRMPGLLEELITAGADNRWRINVSVGTHETELTCDSGADANWIRIDTYRDMVSVLLCTQNSCIVYSCIQKFRISCIRILQISCTRRVFV